MRKVLVLCLGACLYTLGTWAQVTPKWVEKAKRAVFSVVTYDKEGKMMNTGNGFFVSDDGVALSDYSLFRGAARAEIISVEGKKMPVSVILGADDMYDVIKFQVAITGKKVHALDVAATSPAVGDKAWMLPYSTQKSIACVSGTVKEVSKGAANSHYYTLEMALKDKMVSCPLMNEEGEVFGIAQKASGADTASICYAVEASYGTSLRTNALSLSDHALKDIGILTGLPDAFSSQSQDVGKRPHHHQEVPVEILHLPDTLLCFLSRITLPVFLDPDRRKEGDQHFLAAHRAASRTSASVGRGKCFVQV